MLIQLPAETWMEILSWLKRRDLLKKLDQLWDRQFTPIVQDWFHKYTRNVKIGQLWTTNNGLHLPGRGWRKVPFAEVDMPANVTSFERINIRYLDSNVLTFLRQMRPLFHKICLLIGRDFKQDYLTRTRTAHRALLPVIGDGSIESLFLDCELLPFFSTNYQPPVLVTVKLLQIYGYFNSDVTNELLINWLFTPRLDGQPRTLLLSRCEVPASFWEKIRERFLGPNQSASPFFIRMRINLPNLPMVIENVRTGEQLVVKSAYHSVLITNCPLNVNPEWLAKEEKEVLKWKFMNQQKAIWVNQTLLGPLNDDDN